MLQVPKIILDFFYFFFCIKKLLPTKLEHDFFVLIVQILKLSMNLIKT